MRFVWVLHSAGSPGLIYWQQPWVTSRGHIHVYDLSSYLLTYLVPGMVPGECISYGVPGMCYSYAHDADVVDGVVQLL